MIEKSIAILSRCYKVRGDEEYLGSMGAHFEPAITALFSCLCDVNDVVIDIGANIGLTTIALSNLSPAGKVIAIEPVPQAFEFLKYNVKSAGLENVFQYNIAAGRTKSFANMFIDDRNLASAFIVDTTNEKEAAGIAVDRLDDLFPRFGVDSIDFVKIDVEGFEIEVLAGAKMVIERFQPIVLLEMNHWCLNVFRRTCIPEFHEKLLEIFPVLLAIHDSEVVDFTDPANIGRIFHEHVVGNRFMNLVAGFDRNSIESRLLKLPSHIQRLLSVPVCDQ